MREFKLEIVTPDGLVFSGNAESLLVHTDDGDVEILAGHMDYMASVGTGRARIIVGGVSKFASCSGGFLTVNREGVKLAAVTFEFGENIDVARAERARDKAKAKLEAARDERSATLARARLERALTRIKVAKM